MIFEGEANRHQSRAKTAWVGLHNKLFNNIGNTVFVNDPSPLLLLNSINKEGVGYISLLICSPKITFLDNGRR